MSTSWKKQLHTQLVQNLMDGSFADRFTESQAQSPQLRKYPTPQSLLAALQNRESVSYQEKDDVLHSLIAAFQAMPENRSAVLPLLLLCMWPALDHCEYKLAHLNSRFSDLFSEIYWAFVQEVEGFNPAKRTKVAVNLQMNVEKRIRRAAREEPRIRQFSAAAMVMEPEFGNLLAEFGRDRVIRLRELLDTIPEGVIRRAKRSGVPGNGAPGFSQPEQEALKERLRSILPADLLTPQDENLLIGHAIEGRSWAEIGKHMGLSEGAARVRYFRIKAKIRPFLDPAGKPVTP